MPNESRCLTVTALLAVLLLVAGAFKIPSPFIGGEFQLSAPMAVLICALFGFKKYITAGIIASLLGLMLGTATVFNVLIAMVFRLTVGAVLYLAKTHPVSLMLAGPIGTFAARLVLAQITGVSWQILTLAALPGMLFTTVVSAALYKPFQKLMQRACFRGCTEQVK